MESAKLDTTRDEKSSDDIQKSKPTEASSSSKSEPKVQGGEGQRSKSKKAKCRKHAHHKKSTHRRKRKEVVSTDSSSDSNDTQDEADDATSSSSSSDTDSEDERAARKERKRRLLRRKLKAKKKRSGRYDSSESDTETSDSSSESDSSEEERTRRRRRKKQNSRRRVEDSEEEDSDEQEDEDEDDEEIDDEEDEQEMMRQQIEELQSQIQAFRYPHGRARRGLGGRKPLRPKPIQLDSPTGQRKHRKASGKGKKKRSAKRASTLEFKRVDQLWDTTIHDYKLTESADHQGDEFNEYIFTVRRTFDWENKYKNTVVDIKSKLLKEALAEVMKDVKGVSLVEEEPTVDPNMLFLYHDELRTHIKKTLKARRKSEKKRKLKKRVALMIAHCKVLLSYIDEDYEETKKTLYPLLEAGNITFELLWALFKPNSLAYTATYGSVEDPRCFKVDYANKESSFMRGEWYSIEGRYLEYDGKSFGLGEFEATVDSFKGPRKITGLPCYPLKYHRDPEGLKKLLIDRGKKFVGLQGMNYRFHKGLAFAKKKKSVAKVNINGRVMVDPAIFRRVNPNYPISSIKPKEPDDDDESDSDACSDCCGSSSSDEGAGAPKKKDEDDEEKVRMKTKVVVDRNEKVHVFQVEVDENGAEVQVENLDTLPERQFTEEELIIASPVVLGFAFSEKLWLEFSLSGITDIEWNEGAFESLVIPETQKSIVKALVESHKFHAAKTIDDVVQGKGKGLVAVLHGPPGTGKTLTAEGIAELLKCPLYMVSAGELGTDPRTLEHELQKILDIAHSWGAVLLLDEADVFLEKREVHDIHRNALVSIFLRLLEYFQGILFLTTNRVETFDDAFQSRIHVALRYGELTAKAKKAVWKLFIEKVRAMEGDMVGVGVADFKELDYENLAKRQMNGRQIKNAVRTAQALAVNEKTKLTMEHIQRVLVVAESFDHDLKGGTGYMDAMRSYT